MTALERLIKLAFCVVVVALCGCGSPFPTAWKSMPVQTNQYTRIVDPDGSYQYRIQFSSIRGHDYLIVQDNGIAIVHAESCQCKWGGVFVHGYVTNYPVMLRYQTNVVTELAPDVMESIVNRLKEKK